MAYYGIGTVTFLPRIKRPERETTTFAEVETVWSCTSTPRYAVMASCLINL